MHIHTSFTVSQTTTPTQQQHTTNPQQHTTPTQQQHTTTTTTHNHKPTTTNPQPQTHNNTPTTTNPQPQTHNHNPQQTTPQQTNPQCLLLSLFSSSRSSPRTGSPAFCRADHRQGRVDGAENCGGSAVAVHHRRAGDAFD